MKPCKCLLVLALTACVAIAWGAPAKRERHDGVNDYLLRMSGILRPAMLSHRLPMLVFVVAVLAVYATAGLLIVRAIGRRLKPDAPRATRGERWAFRISVSLAVVGLHCMGYAWLVEPYWLEVTRLTMATPKLPKGTRPIRIVQISDLHSDARPRLEERLPVAVADQKPDLIVFTGDGANSPEGMPVFKRCLSRIAKIAPTFAVKGNWDVYQMGGHPVLAGTGARELNGDAAVLSFGGARLWLGGIAFGHEEKFARLLDRAPSSVFRLVLCHYDALVYEAADRGVDLYLCGHTHGGQVALPFYGALITLARFGKRFERGLYQVGAMRLYVNRGIGMEGGRAPRVRFWSRPELTVIELVPSE